MATVTASDGIRLSFFRQGQQHPGPTVIFLHGWCSNAQEWLPFADALGETATLCWNARGHGTQPLPDQPDTSLGRMARDLKELIEQLALDEVMLVGHSMGALTVWRYIQEYGCDRLKGLCIIDQSPRLLTDPQWDLGIFGDFTQEHNRHFCQRLHEDFPQAVTRLILARLDDSPLPESKTVRRLYDYLQRLHGPQLAACWESLCAADLRPVMAQIQVPTLLLYGDRSQFYGPRVARWVNRHIPGSTLIRYAQADHSPHLMERERFIGDLTNHIESLRAMDSHSDTGRCERYAYR